MKKIGRYMGINSFELSYGDKLFSQEMRKVRYNFLNFNLEEFFGMGNYQDAGVLIVTPSQVIGGSNLGNDNCFVHRVIAEIIYRSIYLKRDFSNFDFDNLFREVVKDGNICICMFRNDCVLFVPKVLSILQYYFLEVLNLRLKDIQNNNFDIDMIWTIECSDGMYNGIDVALEHLEECVGCNVSRDDEQIIGFRLKTLSRIDDLDKLKKLKRE